MKSPRFTPHFTHLLAVAFLAAGTSAADLTRPMVSADLVFEEVDGVLAVEAEHFHRQTLTDQRAWHITSSMAVPDIRPDADPPHLAGASGGAYVELLPDTRATHQDKLIDGENFSNQPGRMAVLHYRIHINHPGRYYVWVRAYSTGSEDNGVHVGLNGQWPESGRRWQTVQKNQWAWDNKQRTAQVHAGEPWKLFLDIDRPGEHEIQFSLREDGFEMDKFVLARSRDFRPEGTGPAVRVKSGRLPEPFPIVAAAAPVRPAALVPPRRPDGSGEVIVTGELRQWHKITLTLDGPFVHERDTDPNPFTDCAFSVTFTHESGEPRYVVPGYFAADGDAANTGAESGTKWRAHLSPDKAGKWTYATSLLRGRNVAVDAAAAAQAAPGWLAGGSFMVGATDKTGRDFRAHGRLQYVGRHHLQFAGSKQFFLKAGADAPETLLAYVDFDGTEARKKNVPLKTWQPHVRDWRDGDPTWRGGKGKGLIGALNYLASTGCNAFSFLPYNADGDGDNVWPFVERDAKLHYDCSKLDQWGIVFDHATKLGLYCHFKLQETENDDERHGPQRNERPTPVALDGGALGPERKLYLREMIARFGHLLALNWNLGEENTQTTEEQRAMADYIARTDPWQHLRVIHTYPNEQERVYTPLLGDQSSLTGASLQNSWNQVHPRTLQWVTASAQAGKPWVVANDEQGPASLGVPPDPGYQGHDGVAAVPSRPDAKGKAPRPEETRGYTLHDIRKLTLWGNLMAGGAGVEYYFGYKLPENDLLCEDWRSRHQSWQWAALALAFFRDEQVPFQDMANANALIGNAKNDNSKFCLAKAGELYLVYLPNGGSAGLDLRDANGRFTVQWFNPREGGPLTPSGSPSKGGGRITLQAPDSNDWLAVVRAVP